MLNKFPLYAECAQDHGMGTTALAVRVKFPPQTIDLDVLRDLGFRPGFGGVSLRRSPVGDEATEPSFQRAWIVAAVDLFHALGAEQVYVDGSLLAAAKIPPRLSTRYVPRLGYEVNRDVYNYCRQKS